MVCSRCDKAVTLTLNSSMRLCTATESIAHIHTHTQAHVRTERERETKRQRRSEEKLAGINFCTQHVVMTWLTQ